MGTDPLKGEFGLTGPKRRSAGVVVLRRLDREWRCLLLRCDRYWDFPKGEIEPGEDPLLAARREVGEEAGLQSLDFRWGEDYVETPPYASGKVARYYLAECAAGEVIPEHQEFRWVGRVLPARLHEFRSLAR